MTGPWVDAELLHRGAEAVVHAGSWMGREAVLKQREPRTWRHPDMDARLTKSRMSAEVRLLRRLHLHGSPVPELLAVDTSAGWMVTSRVQEGLCLIISETVVIRACWKISAPPFAPSMKLGLVMGI